MGKRKIGSWRPARPHCAPPRPQGDDRVQRGWIPAMHFFDQLSFIGDARYGCFVLETEDGLIQFDCLNFDQYSMDVLEDGYKELGLDMHDLKAILVTHGHSDHWGCSEQVREKYGAKIYMSKVDYEYASDKNDPFRKELGLPDMEFEVDGYLDEGDVFELGNTKVKVYSTPGHSVGCLSYIFPVTDEGRPHTVAMWGGTGTPRSEEDCQTYIRSVQHFMKACIDNKADVEISSHPFVDNGMERLALCRNIFDGVANPFVVGVDGVSRFMQMLAGRIVYDLEMRKQRKR